MTYKESVNKLHDLNPNYKKFVFDYYRNVVNKIAPEDKQIVIATTDPNAQYDEYCGAPDYDSSDMFIEGEVALLWIPKIDDVDTLLDEVDGSCFMRDKATITYA